MARPLTGRGTKGTSRSLTRGFGAGRGTIPGVSPRAVVGSALAALIALIAADLLASRVAPGPDVALGLGLVAVLGLVARVAGLSPADLGLARSSWRAGLRWGAAAAAIPLAAFAIALALPPLRDAGSDIGAPSWPAAMMRVLVVIPLGTVIHEELAFRGVLFGLLRRDRGRRAAVLGSSTLFGLWHVVPALAGGPTNTAIADAVGSGAGGTVLRVAGTVLLTAMGGVVLCELRIRSGSLLAPILLHWAVNAGGVLFVMLA